MILYSLFILVNSHQLALATGEFRNRVQTAALSFKGVALWTYDSTSPVF
jgi:hypothetical protein